MSFPFNESVNAKAQRLVNEHRVTFVNGVFLVEGDTQRYVVQLTNGRITCSCPWGVNRPDSTETKPCSHALAAAISQPATTPPPKAPARPATTSLNPRSRRHHARNIFLTHGNPVRVTGADELRALRYLADPTTRFYTENDVDFAICDQTVLNVAVRQAEGECGR